MTNHGAKSRSDKLTLDERQKFGALLKLWREVNNLSGDMLASELGTDKWQISRIECGTYALPVSTAIQIAAHTGMDLDRMSFSYRGYRITLS